MADPVNPTIDFETVLNIFRMARDASERARSTPKFLSDIDDAISYVIYLEDKLEKTRRRKDEIEDAYKQTSYEVEQILGKALRYPWFMEDPKNFPDATEETGVCVGDHVPETLATEAARKIEELRNQVGDGEADASDYRLALIRIGTGAIDGLSDLAIKQQWQEFAVALQQFARESHK